MDLSLLVPAGDICVLVGPSGCGKTTSLKMVNRLVEPSSGQVLIDGEDVMKVEVTELRRRIGYVIQQVGLFPHQTVADNIATVPRLLGWPRERTQKRVEELLELIGLDPARVRNRYPSQLSGGERQRVGVARAMAAEPPVMLMDEPFGAVDPIVRERLQNEFLRLHRTLGTTVLFVTHDIDEAIKMGTRVAVMQQGGHLAQYAPPVELLLHPPTSSSPASSAPIAASSGSPCCASPTSSSSEGSWPTSANTPDSVAAARVTAGAKYVLLLDRSDQPQGWMRLDARHERDARPPTTSTRRRRWSTSRRRCATRCRCCWPRTSRPPSSSTSAAAIWAS